MTITDPLTTLTPAQREAVRALIRNGMQRVFRVLGHVEVGYGGWQGYEAEALALLPEPTVKVPRGYIEAGDTSTTSRREFVWDGDDLVARFVNDETDEFGDGDDDHWRLQAEDIVQLAAIKGAHDTLDASDPRSVRWLKYLETKK